MYSKRFSDNLLSDHEKPPIRILGLKAYGTLTPEPALSSTVPVHYHKRGLPAREENREVRSPCTETRAHCKGSAQAACPDAAGRAALIRFPPGRAAAALGDGGSGLGRSRGRDQKPGAEQNRAARPSRCTASPAALEEAAEPWLITALNDLAAHEANLKLVGSCPGPPGDAQPCFSFGWQGAVPAGRWRAWVHSGGSLPKALAREPQPLGAAKPALEVLLGCQVGTGGACSSIQLQIYIPSLFEVTDVPTQPPDRLTCSRSSFKPSRPAEVWHMSHETYWMSSSLVSSTLPSSSWRQGRILKAAKVSLHAYV
ncbi:PREDICTED: uncharacterized protein LOC104830399 [Haliaeetus leucocephalus]|uniref:uncharacterized protein LOC104830399 n=1 Tax=Haliaeetus leucocephalus TaxID=52644 RepID=UPI00053CE33B|nr:PREDICTED: uncharacterized protein LOC104830399 [Haliaeetus leucocephalus]